MKITITTIEASAEELKANRSLSDVLMDVLSRACDAVARPVAEAEEGSVIMEKMDGGDSE
jgi:hypothetical protein